MSNRILNTHFPSEEARERVEKGLIRDRSDSIGNAFETESFRSIDQDYDVDKDGLPISQMEDGMAQKSKARFW